MMSTTTTDGPDTTTTDAVTTDGPTAGPTEPGETTTTKKPPSGGDGELCLETQQCPPPPANCNIPDLMDREDCGELASTPTTCIASGCCWEEQPPGPIPDDPEGRWPPCATTLHKLCNKN